MKDAQELLELMHGMMRWSSSPADCVVVMHPDDHCLLLAEADGYVCVKGVLVGSTFMGSTFMGRTIITDSNVTQIGRAHV